MSVRPFQAIALLLFPVLAIAAFEGVQGLRSARTERAIARASGKPTPIRPDEGVAITAADRSGAEKALTRLLADRASQAGVRLATGIVMTDKDGHFVGSDVVADGAEAAVLKFAAGVESGKPTARLERWTLTPTTAGLRLEGRAIAFWQPAHPPAPTGEAIPIPASDATPAAPTGLFAAASVSKAHGGFPAELIGITGRIAVDPQAMLRLPDGKTQTLAVGETIDGWKLESADADRVRFRKGGQEKTLVLPTASE